MSGLASDNISATSIRVHGVLRDRDTCVFCGKRSTPPPNDPFAPVFAFFSLVDCAHYACQPCALVHCDNAGRHIRCPTCCVVSRLAQSGRRRGHRVDERVSIDDGVSSAASHSIRRPQMPLRSAFAPAGRRRRTNSVQFPENLVKSTSHSDGTVVSGTSVFNSALTLRAVGRLPADPSYSKNMESKKGTTAASSEEQVSVNLYTIRATSTKHRKRVTVNRSHSLPLPPTEHRYLQPSAPFHHPPPLVIRTVEEEEEVLASFQLIVREIEQTIIATLAKEEEERKIIATAEEHRRGSIHRLYESHERQRLARQNTLLEEFSDSRISPRSTTNASEDQVSASSNEEEMDIHRTQSKYIVQGSQEEAPPTPLHVQPNLKQITKEQLKNRYSLEGQKEEKQNKSVTNESHIRRNDSGNTQQMQEQNIMAKEEEQNKQSTITEELRARDILCSDESSERAMYATDERRERVEAAMWNSEQQLRLLEQLVDLVREEQQQRVKIQRDEARLQAEMERAEVNDVTAIRATIEAVAETLRREQEGVLRDEGEERYDIQEEERRTRRLIVRKSSEYPINLGSLVENDLMRCVDSRRGLSFPVEFSAVSASGFLGECVISCGGDGIASDGVGVSFFQCIVAECLFNAFKLCSDSSNLPLDFKSLNDGGADVEELECCSNCLYLSFRGSSSDSSVGVASPDDAQCSPVPAGGGATELTDSSYLRGVELRSLGVSEVPRIPVDHICRNCCSTERTECVGCSSSLCIHCAPTSVNRPCCKLHLLSAANNKRLLLAERRVNARRSQREVVQKYRLGKRVRRQESGGVEIYWVERVVESVPTEQRERKQHERCEGWDPSSAPSRERCSESGASGSSVLGARGAAAPELTSLQSCGFEHHRHYDGHSESESVKTESVLSEPKTERNWAKVFFVPLGNEAPRRPKPPTPRNYVPGMVNNHPRRSKVSSEKHIKGRPHNNERQCASRCASRSRWTAISQHGGPYSPAAIQRRQRTPLTRHRESPVAERQPLGRARGGTGRMNGTSVPGQRKWDGRQRNARAERRAPIEHDVESVACNARERQHSDPSGLGRTFYDGRPVRSGVVDFNFDSFTGSNVNSTLANGHHNSGMSPTRMCGRQCFPLPEEFHASSTPPRWRSTHSRDRVQQQSQHRTTLGGVRGHIVAPRQQSSQRLRHLYQRIVTDRLHNPGPDRHCMRHQNDTSTDVDHTALSGFGGAQGRLPRRTFEPCAAAYVLPPPKSGGRPEVIGGPTSQAPTPQRRSSRPRRRSQFPGSSPPWRTDLNSPFMGPAWNTRQTHSFVTRWSAHKA